jgi:hypothetical protein
MAISPVTKSDLIRKTIKLLLVAIIMLETDF